MNNCLRYIATLLLLLQGLSGFTAQLEKGISFEIRNILEGVDQEFSVLFRDSPISSMNLLFQFYSDRGFEGAWITNGQLTCSAYELRHLIKLSKYDGLFPEDYHIEKLDDFFSMANDNLLLTPMQKATLDILLSDAFISYATHLFGGKVHPENVSNTWDIPYKTSKPEVLENLREALVTENVREALYSLRPKFLIYPRMRRSLMQYHEKAKEVKGDWVKIKYQVSIKPLESHPSIPSIRERLVFWKDLTPYESENKMEYDSLMMKGIMTFQIRNGLNPDGIIGNTTIRALNKSPEMLISQVAVNLERLRWLPDTTLNEFILVNIANYSLDYIRNRDTLLHSTAIVGKAYRKTPVFNAQLSYLVFSPTWTVPPTILRNDVIPAIKKDRQYLANKRMRLLNASGQEVDPDGIDWSRISGSNFPYTVRQDPGPHNSLGLVKFMFPNKYNVYIHDTPSGNYLPGKTGP
jgi:L,D-transpeptidase YcbB